MMMFIFVIILSFLAVGPLNYLHLSWGTTPQSKRPIPCHIFSILRVSYTIKCSFRDHEEPQAVIFLHGIWRHIKEFGIEGQIPRLSLPVKLEKRC